MSYIRYLTAKGKRSSQAIDSASAKGWSGADAAVEPGFHLMKITPTPFAALPRHPIIAKSFTRGYVNVHARSIALLVLACAAGGAHAQQGDPGVARAIAANCANCHGTNGVSQGGVPSLAGQTKAELVRKMQDFKAGRTPSTVMTQLAKGYTDEQIELTAAFFEAQKPGAPR